MDLCFFPLNLRFLLLRDRFKKYPALGFKNWTQVRGWFLGLKKTKLERKESRAASINLDKAFLLNNFGQKQGSPTSATPIPKNELENVSRIVKLSFFLVIKRLSSGMHYCYTFLVIRYFLNTPCIRFMPVTKQFLCF